jgi:mRNA interferase MazF
MIDRSYVPDRGDVVWLELNPQSGHEPAGRRPALTISPEAYNRRGGLGLFCPITNKSKGYPFEVAIPENDEVTGVVLADQLKSLDWRSRKAEYFTKVDEETVLEVVGKLLPLIDPNEEFGASEASGG